MLTAVGLTRSVFQYQATSVFLNLVLSIFFIQLFGLRGVVLGTLISNSLLWVPYSRLILKTFNTSVALWAKITLIPSLTAVLTQGIFFLVLHYIVQMPHNLEIFVGAATTLISLCLTYLVTKKNNQVLVKS
jgi:peptidoglycan biosynthesis protein MviN/MurJ (putative lipid II flippase)